MTWHPIGFRMIITKKERDKAAFLNNLAQIEKKKIISEN